MIAVKEFSREEVKEIRGAAKMTQAAFAEFLGVSKKTVEAWESGRNKPSGACCRLLALLEVNPAFPESYDSMLQKG